MIPHDFYTPKPAVKCPKCGKIIKEWVGFDGPCVGKKFTQGDPWPAPHRYWALTIYGTCSTEGCIRVVEATGHVPGKSRKEQFKWETLEVHWDDAVT